MKIILKILAALVSIVVIVTLVGLALPQSHVASTRTAFRASQEQVWNAVTNVHDYPLWRSDVKSVTIFKSASGHISWAETGSNGMIQYDQVEAVPPSHLLVKLTDESLPFGGTWTYDISPAASGSQLVITENGIVRNPIFRFMSRFVFGHYGTQETFVRDLAKRLGETVKPERLGS